MVSSTMCELFSEPFVGGNRYGKSYNIYVRAIRALNERRRRRSALTNLIKNCTIRKHLRDSRSKNRFKYAHTIAVYQTLTCKHSPNHRPHMPSKTYAQIHHNHHHTADKCAHQYQITHATSRIALSFSLWGIHRMKALKWKIVSV